MLNQRELQLPATATATRDLSHVFDLHHSSRQCQLPSPLSNARNQTHILLDSSWICFRYAMKGTLPCVSVFDIYYLCGFIGYRKNAQCWILLLFIFPLRICLFVPYFNIFQNYSLKVLILLVVWIQTGDLITAILECLYCKTPCRALAQVRVNFRYFQFVYHRKLFFFFFFWSFVFSRAAPKAYGSSQARDGIRAVATGLHHSNSNEGSKPHLRPTPQLTATLDP